MSESADIIIHCPLCRGQIIYPPDREGEEVACPHCEESIYLLSKELPPPPAKPDVPVASPVADLEAEETAKAESEKAPSLHAATQQRLADGRRKAVIKSKANGFSATPPNRKKICTPASNVIKIPHILAPVDLEKEGTAMSPEIIYRHPAEFALTKKAGMLGGKSSQWQARWTVIHVQNRESKPWVILLLAGESSEPTITRRLLMKVAEQSFDFPTDAEGDRQNGKAPEAEAQKTQNERFSYEHDDFRFLCAQLVASEELEMEFDGADFQISKSICAGFREYTIKFFEAIRRESPLYFR
jgi:hypothetical protein